VRTPNTQCVLCAKPLYRRPFELAKTRYAACLPCRAKAQSVVGVTAAQQAGLARGRVKGDNRRRGYVHREESRAKCSAANKAYWDANPELAVARGAKLRAEKHYLWNGGITKLNKSIRQMHENRKWMDAVKARDGRCLRCGSTSDLESHHVKALGALIGELGIKSREDARRHAGVLWDLANGETLCEPCHYAEHGRLQPCG
jgi:5-methylcytosine-specific restriction endonuclease McrA